MAQSLLGTSWCPLMQRPGGCTVMGCTYAHAAGMIGRATSAGQIPPTVPSFYFSSTSANGVQKASSYQPLPSVFEQRTLNKAPCYSFTRLGWCANANCSFHHSTPPLEQSASSPLPNQQISQPSRTHSTTNKLNDHNPYLQAISSSDINDEDQQTDSGRFVTLAQASNGVKYVGATRQQRNYGITNNVHSEDVAPNNLRIENQNTYASGNKKSTNNSTSATASSYHQDNSEKRNDLRTNDSLFVHPDRNYDTKYSINDTNHTQHGNEQATFTSALVTQREQHQKQQPMALSSPQQYLSPSSNTLSLSNDLNSRRTVCKLFGTVQGCDKGDECDFLHLSVKQLPEICNRYLSPEGCALGDKCDSVHKRSPELCSSWNATPGSCSQGNNCKFTHAAGVLLSQQKLSSDGAKYRNAPICKSFISAHGCAQGDACGMLHPANFNTEALRSQTSRTSLPTSFLSPSNEATVISSRFKRSRSPMSKTATKRASKNELSRTHSLAPNFERKNAFWKCVICGNLQPDGNNKCSRCTAARPLSSMQETTHNEKKTGVRHIETGWEGSSQINNSSLQDLKWKRDSHSELSLTDSDWQRVASWFSERAQAGAPLRFASEKEGPKRRVEMRRRVTSVPSESPTQSRYNVAPDTVEQDKKPIWWSFDAESSFAHPSEDAQQDILLSAQRALSHPGVVDAIPTAATSTPLLKTNTALRQVTPNNKPGVIISQRVVTIPKQTVLTPITQNLNMIHHVLTPNSGNIRVQKTNFQTIHNAGQRKFVGAQKVQFRPV